MTEIKFDKHRYHEHHDMMQWCNDNLGDGCWGQLDGPERYGINRTGQERWSYEWAGYGGKFSFQFRNEQDAMLFSLRWS